MIALGAQVLATCQDSRIGRVVDSQMAHQWVTSTENLLTRVFGQDGAHYQNLKTQTAGHISYLQAVKAQGILLAAKDDYEHGQLFEIRRLIEAEVFDDFLEQSEHLLESGYHPPAAVIAGCVLEDGLRKLCEANRIPVSLKPKLDTMNSDLAKAGVYSKLVQKRITALADLRNKAAHGKWDQFTKKDVVEMLQSVRRLMEENFA